MAHSASAHEMTRREFGALTAGTLAAAAVPVPARAQMHTARVSADAVLDVADWGYYWYGVERATLARGTMVDGRQMFVEHWIPTEVRHPYPVVLVHGGYGQASDWMSTPDDRRGWASLLLEQGYAVYLVDRPGQGRNPHHPWVHGLYDREAPTFDRVAASVAGTPGAHTQWPGRADAADPAVAQVAAAMGQPMAVNAVTLDLWRSRGSLLLDDIGPSIFMTHGDGALFAWVTAEARPALVKAVVAVEPTAPSPGVLAALPASLPTAVVTAAASPTSAAQAATAAALAAAGARIEHIRLAERGVGGNGPLVMLERNSREALQPALDWMRRVEAPLGGAPFVATPGRDPSRNTESTAVRLAGQGGFFVGIGRKEMPYGTIPQGQMFVQYMIPAEQRYPYPVVMVHGGGGQGTHMMGLGRRPGWVHYFVQSGYAVYWLDRPSYGRSPYHPDALGPSHLPNVPPYEPLLGAVNVFQTGQWPGPGGMDDEYINQFMACESGNTSDEAFHSALVWPGGAELLDRIGPSILHTHAFGGFFGWGVADRRPDLVKGILCMEINGNPFARQLQWGLTAGPMTYDPPATSPGDFTLADHTPPADSPRPIASPYQLQAEPARRWKNLQGIPIGWITSEYGAGGSPVANVAFLKQVGCTVEMLRLRDDGILGNGNLMLMEQNNHEVFTVVRDWLDRNVAAPGRVG
jgi:pimeloyl-ACP methyl ester carboxylesterase